MTRALLALLTLSTVLSAAFLGVLVYEQRQERQRLYEQAREADRASAKYAELWLQSEGKLDFCRAL